MIFLASITYSEITPESASNGDFSETGYHQTPRVYSLRELIDLIKREGFYRESGTDWMTSGYYTSCYQTGTEREESLHVKMLPDSTRFVMMDEGEGQYRWRIEALTDHKRTQIYSCQTRQEARELVALLNKETQTTLQLRGA